MSPPDAQNQVLRGLGHTEILLLPQDLVRGVDDLRGERLAFLALGIERGHEIEPFAQRDRQLLGAQRFEQAKQHGAGPSAPPPAGDA